MLPFRRILYPSIKINQEEVLSALDGKVILITGATFGIGEALVRKLMHCHVHLLLVARTSEKLLSLKNESLSLPAEVSTFVCDLYDEESIHALYKQLQAFNIDYLVSNAGKSLMRSLMDERHRFSDFKKTMAVNYLAPVQLILALVENFKRAQTHIVNVSTYNVLMRTPPGWSAYVSSKKAIYSWFESNAPELALMHISVSNIFLPLVDSRMKDANSTYKNTPAMRMDTAVAVITKGLINRNYHFKPWWHIPFQIVLFFFNPMWRRYWSGRLRQQKN